MTHTTDNFTQRVSIHKALNCIRKGDGLAKTIDSNKQNEGRWTDWDHELKQLKDPVNFRPFKEGNEKYRHLIWRCSQRKYVEKQQHGQRGHPKMTIFTKKSCVSLLPKTGSMHLYDRTDWDGNATQDFSTGLVFDLKECKILKDYIFNRDVGTNSRWWYKDSPEQKTILDRIEGLYPEIYEKYKNNKNALVDLITSEAFTSLEKLKSDLESPAFFTVTKYNELLAKLTKGALRAVITKNKTIEQRLNGIARKLLIREFLNIDLPIVFINDDQSATVYRLEQQLNDMLYFSSIKGVNSTNETKFIGNSISFQSYLSYFQELKKVQENYHTINKRLVNLKEQNTDELLNNAEILLAVSVQKNIEPELSNLLEEIQRRLFLNDKDSMALKTASIKNQALETEIKHFLQSSHDKISHYCDECIQEWRNDSKSLPQTKLVSQIKNILTTKSQSLSLSDLIQKRLNAANLFIEQERLLQEDSNPKLQVLLQLMKVIFSLGIYAVYETYQSSQKTGTWFTWFTESKGSRLRYVFEKNGADLGLRKICV